MPEQQNCRDLGRGHHYTQFSETETTVTYCCETCGAEFTEEKKPYILPERRHDTGPE